MDGPADSTRLTRRRLLAAGAGVAAAGALGSVALGRRDAAERAFGQGAGSAVVVGAGLAGLAAAYELRQGGWDVTVLEARDRIGGRVHTLRDFEGGQHAEGGGEFIDTVHTRMIEYVRRFGLELEDTRRGFGGLSDAIYVRGRLHRYGSLVGWPVRREMNRYWRAIAGLSRDLDPDDPVAGGGELDERTAADLLDELEIDGLARFLLDAYVRDDYGVEADRLSLLFNAQGERLYRSVGGGQIEVFRIRGGNDGLPAAIAAALGDSVRLGEPVSRIAQSGGGVEVTTPAGSVAADHCVVAAPLPALRAISFEPALPAALASAISDLQYGSVTKNALQYPSRPWRAAGYSGAAYTDLPLGSTYEVTDQQPGRRGILLAYAGGERSAFFESMDAGDRGRAAARQMRRLLGRRPPPLRSSSVSWALEPLTGGSWTAYAPGQVTSYWRALREPYGRIHLAGEHTDSFTGYMEGAVRSGERVAQRLLSG